MDIKTINLEKIIKIARQYLTVTNVSKGLLVLTIGIFITQAWQLYRLYQVTSYENIEQLTDIGQPLFNTELDDDVLELFGHYRLDENIVTQETALPLVLKGIFYSEDEANATAFIAYSGQAEQAYAQGAMLPDNVELYSIQSDHVILYHKNRFERLGFADNEIFTEQIIQPIAGELTSSEPAYSRIISDDYYDGEINSGWSDDEASSSWSDDEANSGWSDDEANIDWFDDDENIDWFDDDENIDWFNDDSYDQYGDDKSGTQ